MKKLASELVQNMQNLTAIKSIDVAVKNTKINLSNTKLNQLIELKGSIKAQDDFDLFQIKQIFF